MRTATLVTMWIVRLSGIVQLALGLLFWTGRALNYIPFHIQNGFLMRTPRGRLATNNAYRRFGYAIPVTRSLSGRPRM
jgi:hypothetical protein